MKYFLFFLTFLFTTALAESPTIIRINGTINPGSAAHIAFAIQAAEDRKSTALIMYLDTPGGLLSSTRQIVQDISNSKVPVVVFVSPSGASATSAGAIIAVSSHIVAMAPGTNIGAAHPVESTGEDIKGDMNAKATNDTAAFVRAQAKLRNRNVELAGKLVTESISLSAEEAQKQGIADIIVSDKIELYKSLQGKKVDLPGGISTTIAFDSNFSDDPLAMKWSHSFLHSISNPTISALLLALGGFAIYTEVASGFSLIAPGVIGIILMILAFISFSTLPITVGGVVLLVVGVGLAVAELFVASGVLSFAGIIAIILGLLFLIDPASSSISVSWLIFGPIFTAVIIIAGVSAYLLSKEKSLKITSKVHPLIGKQAEVMTVDESSYAGQVKISGEIWNFKSDKPVTTGEKIAVIRVEGFTVILES